MRNFRIALSVIAISLLTSIYTQAQSKMWIQIVDYTGARVPNVKLCPQRNFNLCRLSSDGLTEITLTPEQAQNHFVELFVLTEGYLLIDPWDNKVREHVNPATPIEVKVIQVGDKKALRNDFVVLNLLKMVNYKKQVTENGGGRPVDVMEGALSIVARLSGTTPRELDQMIKASQRRATAAEKGQYALYQGQFSTARKHLLASREASQRERLYQAENDFFLGQTHFRLGEYSEAAESFASAQALGMKDDPRLLEYLARIEGYKGNLTGALGLFEKSLALKERSSSADDPDLLAAKVHLVQLYFLADDSDKVQQLLDEIWDTCDAALAKDFGAAAPALLDLLDFYTDLDDDENLDYDFESEIKWVKALLKTTAHKEVKARHVESVRAGAFLSRIYAESDWDDLDDDERKEVEDSALQLLRLVRVKTAANFTANRRSRSTRRNSRVSQPSDANNVSWTIPILLQLSEFISNERAKIQLFAEGVRLSKSIALEDPFNALLGLMYAAGIARKEDRTSYENLVKTVFEIAERTRLLENPNSAEAVIKFAIDYYAAKPDQEGIRLLFARVTKFSRGIWNNDHALDAATLMLLEQDMDGSVAQRRELLEFPINRVVKNIDEILKTASGLTLLGSTFVGKLCVEFGRYEDAQLVFTKVKDIIENSWGVRHPIALECLVSIAEVQSARGLLEEADATYKQALDTEIRRLGPNHPMIASLLNPRIELLKKMKRVDEATSLSRQALAIEQKDEQAERGRWLQKINKELRELEEKENKLGPNHPDLIPLLSSLIDSYENRSDYEEAATIYKQLVTIYEADKTADAMQVGSAISNFGRALMKLKRYDEAEALYRKSAGLLEHRERGAWMMIKILEDYAELLEKSGKESESADILRRVTELKKSQRPQ